MTIGFPVTESWWKDDALPGPGRYGVPLETVGRVFYSPTTIPCPWCEAPLLRADGDVRRVVRVLRHEGDQALCEVQVAPPDVVILGCNACREGFSIRKERLLHG